MYFSLQYTHFYNSMTQICFHLVNEYYIILSDSFIIFICFFFFYFLFFFFQAEDGIRDLVRSRGLGDVYKRQVSALEGVLRVADQPLSADRLAP